MYVTLSTEPAPVAVVSDFGLPIRAPIPSSRPRRHVAGTHLFREGDAATHLHEIRSGVLRLTRVLENGRRKVIAFGLPGDIIGFPNGDLHHTDCDVIATADLIVHRRQTLESGDGDPQTHQRLLRAALREINAMQDHFMMLARKSALEKVASFLLVLCRRTGRAMGDGTAFSLPMSRADIADFLGLTIETVSRSISCLRKRGMIVLETPQTVLVADMTALIRASQDAD